MMKPEEIKSIEARPKWKKGWKGKQRWLIEYLKQEGLCAICGEKTDTENMTKDHIIPTSKGGSSGWGNIQLVCDFCNQRKGNKLPSLKHKYMFE